MNTAAILKALKYFFLCSNRTELKCSCASYGCPHQPWWLKDTRTHLILTVLLYSWNYNNEHQASINFILPNGPTVCQMSRANSGESRRGVCQGVRHDGMNEVLRVIVVENIYVYRSQPKCFWCYPPFKLVFISQEKVKKKTSTPRSNQLTVGKLFPLWLFATARLVVHLTFWDTYLWPLKSVKESPMEIGHTLVPYLQSLSPSPFFSVFNVAFYLDKKASNYTVV